MQANNYNGSSTYERQSSISTSSVYHKTDKCKSLINTYRMQRSQILAIIASLVNNGVKVNI